MLSSISQGDAALWFQSAPAIAGGRCPPAPAGPVHSSPFQSAPAIAGGRCAAPSAAPGAAGRFNPRPPLLAGDARRRPARRRDRSVSIRARHCWRAMPFGDVGALLEHVVSIRARHCWRAMPIMVCLPGEVSMFQSAPAIAGGRCNPWPPPSQTLACFNPRPPLLAGDATPHSRRIKIGQVSIRARHCWRAMPAQTPGCARTSKFQSAPAIAGGRCPPLRLAARPRLYRFNPRPPLLAGDAAPPGRRWSRP